jgi:hypothetical protein
MADAEIAKPGEDDAALLAAEATDPSVLQEPDREQDFAQPTPEKAVVKRQYSLFGFVIGGALLAGAGFAAAKYAFPDSGADSAIAALSARLDAAATLDAKTQSDIAALSNRAPDTTLLDRLSQVEASLPLVSALEDRLATLEERLTAIEAASATGVGAPAAALAAIDREIKALKAQVVARDAATLIPSEDILAASATAQARLDAAESATIAAAKQAALSHVRAAFESGSPLGPALQGLRSLGADVPAMLTDAENSFPSLLALQDSFAEPARAALDASIRSDMGEGWVNRLTSFLRTQSGARSLTPHDGADPDAVLSRAEAAIKNGQVKGALDELSSLPPAGIEAMAVWVAQATRRLAAEQAINDLSATLSGQ